VILKPDQLRDKLFGPEIVPAWGLVLGSGFDGWQDHLSGIQSVPFEDVEGVQGPTVFGHGGCFTGGFLEKVPVAVCSGRLHLYEGLTAWQVTAPVRVLAEMGVSSMLLTTAVGAVSSLVSPGDVVTVVDQINLTGEDPNEGTGQFPDASALYDQSYVKFLQRSGLGKGVLAGVRGPSYESPAEVRALESIGADMVCMSTVLEALTLAGCAVRCAAVAVVANRAGCKGTTHKEVVKKVRRVASGTWKAAGKLIVSGR
jgi:purine-nucleoside phosphorylase